ncbi:MAG: anti-sigma factor [Actinomycetota bacterium]|nr:anti-sigma factor [Actinomycetota bacterium]
MSDDLHTLVGAYALDALAPSEEVRFEDHLATCSACRQELDELLATAARLGEAVAVAPSPEVRRRLMEAVRRTPQERPLVASIRPGGWRRQAPLLLAAAAVLAVVASLGAFFVERERLEDFQASQSTLSSVLTAPDAQDTTTRVDGGRVRVVSSPALDQAVVLMADMPSPGENKAYELWSVGDDGPVSEGVISTSDLGSAGLHLIDTLDAASSLAMTVEPEGGSPTGKPTSDPVVSVDLTGT